MHKLLLCVLLLVPTYSSALGGGQDSGGGMGAGMGGGADSGSSGAATASSNYPYRSHLRGGATED